jgi:hypothetical protein
MTSLPRAYSKPRFSRGLQAKPSEILDATTETRGKKLPKI